MKHDRELLPEWKRRLAVECQKVRQNWSSAERAARRRRATIMQAELFARVVMLSMQSHPRMATPSYSRRVTSRLVRPHSLPRWSQK